MEKRDVVVIPREDYFFPIEANAGVPLFPDGLHVIGQVTTRTSGRSHWIINVE